MAGGGLATHRSEAPLETEITTVQNHYTISDLLSLGWTRTLIRKHLGTADQILPNARNANRPIRLFECNRVATQANALQPILSTNVQSRARRFTTSTQQLLNQARSWPRNIPTLSLPELRDKSLDWVADTTSTAGMTEEEAVIFQMEYLIESGYPNAEYEKFARKHTSAAQVNQFIRQLLIAEVYQKYPTFRDNLPNYT